MDWTVERLREFEESIRQAYLDGKATGALHLSRGNESQLIEIFKNICPTDFVFSTYRSHYHALLKGIPEDWLREEILAGRSICISNAEHRFFTSSIVGGCLPIATGAALAIKRRGGSERVWCFVGDMAASCGMFSDCKKYAAGFGLPIYFVVENNGYSTNTPTQETWGSEVPLSNPHMRYEYQREWPHSGFKL